MNTAIIKRAAAEAIWQWFNEHRDDVLAEKRIWFIKVVLRIRGLSVNGFEIYDMTHLIERITGTPRPA